MLAMPGVTLSGGLISTGALSADALSGFLQFIQSPVGIELIVQCCVSVNIQSSRSSSSSILRSIGAFDDSRLKIFLSELSYGLIGFRYAIPGGIFCSRTESSQVVMKLFDERSVADGLQSLLGDRYFLASVDRLFFDRVPGMCYRRRRKQIDWKSVRDLLLSDRYDFERLLHDCDLMMQIRGTEVVNGFGNAGVNGNIGTDFIRFLLSYCPPRSGTAESDVLTCLKVIKQRDGNSSTPLLCQHDASSGSLAWYYRSLYDSNKHDHSGRFARESLIFSFLRDEYQKCYGLSGNDYGQPCGTLHYK